MYIGFPCLYNISLMFVMTFTNSPLRQELLVAAWCSYSGHIPAGSWGCSPTWPVRGGVPIHPNAWHAASSLCRPCVTRANQDCYSAQHEAEEERESEQFWKDNFLSVNFTLNPDFMLPPSHQLDLCLVWTLDVQPGSRYHAGAYIWLLH